MRKIALTGLGVVVVFNGLLGYASQHLADMMNLRLQHYGARVPALTVWVLGLPPGFYIVAVLALLALGFGIGRVLRDGEMVCTAFALLIVDVAALLLMLWGVIFVTVRMQWAT